MHELIGSKRIQLTGHRSTCHRSEEVASVHGTFLNSVLHRAFAVEKTTHHLNAEIA
jgi:hypothetical protein